MRKILMLFAKILVSAFLMYLALSKITFGDLLSRLTLKSIGWIALSVFLSLLQVGFSALRWQMIATECGAPLTIAQALRFNMIGSFFNQTLPSSIGGDAARVWLLRKNSNSWRSAVYSVFVDRAIGSLILSVIVVGTLPWSYRLISDAHGRYALLLVDFVALLGGAFFLIIGRLPFTRLTAAWQIKDIFACSVIANRLIFSSRRGLAIISLSFLIHLLSAGIVWGVVRSIETPVSFFEVFELIPPVILITMIPISIAGWGVREATMGLAFGYAGLLASEGINISLLFGAVTFFVGALGGLVWILSTEKPATA